MILDDRSLQSRFASGDRVVEILRRFEADAGATPIADFAWDVAAESGVVRHLRRMTRVGLISLREEPRRPTAIRGSCGRRS